MKVISLKYPVNHGGQPISQLVMHRPRGKDLLILDKHKGNEGMELTLDLISSLCDVPRELAEALDYEDITSASEHIGTFFDRAPSPAPKSAEA